MSDKTLSLDAEARIDAICDGFERAWLNGEAPTLEEYCQPGNSPEDDALFRGLLALDLHYRRQKGQSPGHDDYLCRFPERQQTIEALLADNRTSRDSTAEPPLPSIPGYEILEVLGRGGMGVVYKARQVSLNRVVALKMMSSDYVDEEQLARFRREAETIASMQHSNIVQIYEVGEHQGRPFLALEYAEGGSLENKSKRPTQSPRQVAELLSTLARAIHAAHEQNVLHRDLKPANILLSVNGTPKVTDFGLARRLDTEATHPTVSGALLGTPSYMAPEQATGRIRELGPTTDVYALGATMYELLTGHPPFGGSTLLDTLAQVCTRDPIPPSQYLPKLPGDLDTICLKCLQKSPKDRYESAAALADDLDRFLQGESIRAKSLNLVNRLARMLERSHMDNEFREWSNVLFLFAGIILMCQAAFCWQLRAGVPTWHLLVTRAVQVMLMVGGMWWFHRDGLAPRTQAERQLWSIWIGFIFACTVSAGANRLLFGSGKTFQSALYPMWTAFSGMGFFALGSMYWGGCYAIGLAFFLLALSMPSHIDWAPLSYGILWALVLGWLAMHLRSLEED